MLAVAMLLAACSSGSGGGSSAGSGGGRATLSVQPSPCAWPTRADRQTLNVAYPDADATYWATRYVLGRGERLEIDGVFPAARYFSFVTYYPDGGVRGAVNDRSIAPASVANPFAGTGAGTPGRGRYVVRITPRGARAANTVAGGATGSVIYRVYVPTDAKDPGGGVPLPTMWLVGHTGARRRMAPCATPGPNPATTRLIERNGPPTTTAAPARPIFIRPAATAARLYPNPDNVYLATILHYTPGRLVVVRGRAPTFPDTRAGQPITGREEVRFWSVCTNEYRKPYPVTDCVPDAAVPLDRDGNFTVVISTAAERPANANGSAGVAWLDWGSTAVDDVVLVRNMLPGAGFDQSALNVAPGSLAATTMGPYAPSGVYCAVADFARGGPAACPAAERG